MRALVAGVAILLLLLPLPSCGGSGGSSAPSPVRAAVVLVGAGDIGYCGTTGAAATALLLDAIGGTVFTAGDNAYFSGTAQEFHDCYDPSWGRHKSRTRPAPGNHDYGTAGAAPYFEYFGASAGVPGLGYYSFTAGAWHVVSLNSNVPAEPGSAQLQWLEDDLSQNPARCIAAIWHHPLYSSSEHGPQPNMVDVWRVLQRFGAELALAGHDHVYERFTPLDADGHAVPDGIREFVVGTGGAVLYAFRGTLPGSEVRGADWGVLKLALSESSYTWEFIPVAGGSFRDAGSDVCH